MSGHRLLGWLFVSVLLVGTGCTAQPTAENPPVVSVDGQDIPDNHAAAPTPSVQNPPSDVTEPAPGIPPAPIGVTRVEIAQWDGERYRLITPLEAVSPPGSSQLRFTFSRPVDRMSVEDALQLQPAPVRGYVQWLDDQTMLWYVEMLPARLDFLLGGAVDLYGQALPGGLPSLRVGEPPGLVRLNVQSQTEAFVAVVPADIIAADLATEQGGVNLRAWFPGTATYDWEPVDYFVDLDGHSVRPGRREGPRPRLPAGLQVWQISPSGQTVMGLMGDDLVMLDLRGGRQQTFANMLERPAGIGARHLAWSPDSRRIAVLSGTAPDQADLVTVDVSGQLTVLARDLPVPIRGSRLAWSPSERYLLVGNLLVDLDAGSYMELPSGSTPLGYWAPDGQTLLYTPSYWEETYLIEAGGERLVPLGNGLPVGWVDSESLLLVRWSSSETRYHPPGY